MASSPTDPAAAPSEQARLARALRYSGFDTATSFVLGLASAVVTARVFGAEVVGAFALASMLTGSLHMLSNVREQGGLVRELTRHAPGAPESPALTAITLALSAAITLAVLLPFSALSVWLLGDVFGRPELVLPFAVLAVSYLLLDNTSLNLEAPLVAFREGRALWHARVAMGVTMIAGALACGLAGFDGLAGLVGITVAASVAGLAIRVGAVHRLCGLLPDRAHLRWARSRLRAIVSFGVRSAPQNFTETAVEYADTAVLGATVPLASVGAYSRAYTLYRRAQTVPTSLSRLYFPTLSALHFQGDVAGMARLYRLSSRALVLLLLPAAAWVAACAPGILAVFGPGFEEAAPALAILIFIVVVDAYERTAGGVLAAADRPGVVSAVSVATAVLNVGLCVVLIPRYGITGAAVANLGAQVAILVALPRLAARQLGVSVASMFEPRFLGRLAAACAVLALAMLALRDLPGALLWQALAAAPVLTLALAVFRPLPREDAGAVERGLRAAGLRSPRMLERALALHERFAHGPHRASYATRS